VPVQGRRQVSSGSGEFILQTGYTDSGEPPETPDDERT
jgi:hypothetical protein